MIIDKPTRFESATLTGNVEMAHWLKDNDIRNVECVVADVNGVLRGKILPLEKFLGCMQGEKLYLPSSTLLLGIDGNEYGRLDREIAVRDPDVQLVPDVNSLAADGRKHTAVVFADAFSLAGEPFLDTSRHVLKGVVDLLQSHHVRPVVAPELEFYVFHPDPCKAESFPHPYDMQSLGLFRPVTEQIYSAAKSANIPLDTLIHESGPGQLEINLLHGDPLQLADQVLLFKAIVRRAAADHGMEATFMAKPIAQEAGSSMHLHMSLVGESGENLFADESGRDTEMFEYFIGGLQKYLPETMPLFVPNVNGYRRLSAQHSAPANIEWSMDNRSCGLRVPDGGRHARRVENRLPGADANPYLAIATSLLCGFLGMTEKLPRKKQAQGNVYKMPSTLPKTMEEALDRFAACGTIRSLLGNSFCDSYLQIKTAELNLFRSAVTPWEKQYLQALV